jgi:uncharacterized protein with NAD-binding domain and iron-sulfur cluster
VDRLESVVAVLKSRIAVVGGGYAGFAAAVTLAAAGREVTVFEAARTLGGRSRRVDAYGTCVDNGAHILLGAYRQTLALLRQVHGAGAETELLDRRRLTLEQPGVFRLRAPSLPAPWHLAAALLTMRGVSWRDRVRTAGLPGASHAIGSSVRHNSRSAGSSLISRSRPSPCSGNRCASPH